MSESLAAPSPSDPQGTRPALQLVGDLDAADCVGEICALPAHREQAVMNRRVDSDLI